MQSPATLGTPCLVPVQVDADGTSVRGFITRLSRSSAAVSTDPELPPGQHVSLRFRRPTDNEEVEIAGTVNGLLPGGGLWRGRSAALVELDAALDDEFFGAAELNQDRPRRRGSEAEPEAGLLTPPQSRSSGFGAAFRTGLGKRRRTGVTIRPSAPPPTPEPPPPPSEPPAVKPPSETGRRMAALSDAWAPVHASDDGDPTEPPFLAQERPPPLPETPSGLLESGELPPIQTTQPELAAAIDPFEALVGSAEHLAPVGDVGDSVEDDFFGQFGRVQDLPDYNLPPGAVDDDDVPGTRSDLGPLPGGTPLEPLPVPEPFAAESLMELEPITPEPSRQEAPGLAADGYFDVGNPGVAQADEPAETSFGNLLETGAGHSPVIAPTDQAPPIQDYSLSDVQPQGKAPWESEDFAAKSLIPRNARIASSLGVTFWARGRSHGATAQNFSKEGLFLATQDPPPVRGAIVRIEFPIEGEGDPVPVRFNAEVRWHQSDRPQAGLPEGFGVQILTFESPKDRVRYDELLLLILTLNAERDREEAQAFKWGRSGGSS